MCTRCLVEQFPCLKKVDKNKDQRRLEFILDLLTRLSIDSINNLTNKILVFIDLCYVCLFKNKQYKDDVVVHCSCVCMQYGVCFLFRCICIVKCPYMDYSNITITSHYVYKAISTV